MFCCDECTCCSISSYEDVRRTPQLKSDLHAELLDEEFQCYLRVGNSFLKTLTRPKDIEVGRKLIATCVKLNRSSDTDVKNYTNNFLRYFLKVLNWTANNQPLNIYENWYIRHCIPSNGQMETSVWLKEDKSYMSIKDMPDGSVLIYCAVSKYPNSWQYGTLKTLATANANEC